MQIEKIPPYKHQILQNTLPFKTTSQSIYDSLKNKAYFNVPFSISPQTIEEAVDAFFEFLKEPESIKNHIDFSIAPLHRRGDVGYKHRNAKNHIYDDSKDFFHFHPALFEKYGNFLEKNPIVKNFVLKAQPIWDLAYTTVWNLLKTMEDDCPDLCSKVFNTKDIHLLLRFLRYDWQSSGKYLAKPHYDAGSFTLAIAESCPGLRIGDSPETLQAVKHKPKEAIFMLSSNFEKIMIKEDLAAGWHDVIQLDETIIGKPFSRWAVVAFIEGHSLEALDRTETHKWYKAAS
jgi:isopenicillin N synthase-like dioxygenase